jgi:hypothetical protein
MAEKDAEAGAGTGRVDDDVQEVWDDWQRAVNMTPSELERWLDTDESRSVGQKEGGGESVGHRSGRRIVAIKQKNKSELTGEDAAHMRKVVGYVARHGQQRPEGDVTDTDWRYSLMNWGHDPMKA